MSPAGAFGKPGAARDAATVARTSSSSVPERVLAVDVGAGTTDILLTRSGQPLENAVKLVVPSRTQVVAAQIAQATERRLPILFEGPTMGGGADTSAMREHLAAGLAFCATPAAALTFADDLERVRDLGVTVLEGGAHTAPPGATAILSGDLDPAALRSALALLGADFAIDAVAIAAQDHGFAPHGSNRVLRFAMWEAAVADGRTLPELFYQAEAIPPQLTRLHSAARLAGALAAGCPVTAADTGPAALFGALPEDTDDAVLVNLGNGHTVCAVALAGRLAGVFEHHTSSLEATGLEQRLRRFLRGGLTSDEVRADGGHGAVLAPGAACRNLLELPLFVTGPQRGLLAGSSLPFRFAAPHGDMMLTGCFGLLRAVRRPPVDPA